jgi:hypothetical protein
LLSLSFILKTRDGNRKRFVKRVAHCVSGQRITNDRRSQASKGVPSFPTNIMVSKQRIFFIKKKINL